MHRLHIALWMAFSLAACSSTSVTPLSQNQFLIQTTGDLPCGKSGTEKIATQMAAVETIRRGFDRFVVKTTETDETFDGYKRTGLQKQVKAINDDPIGKTIMQGSISEIHAESLIVTMLRPGDAGFDTATDARAVLGPDWQKTVSDGVSSCTGL